MSLAKQIGIGVLATISLVLFGLGSYAASKQIFPDPKATTNTTATPTSSVGGVAPSVSDVKRVEPKSITFKKNGDDTVITFETAEKVGATVYVTSSKSERILQTMKDRRNGVPNIGNWFEATANNQPAATHSVRIPKEAMAKTGNTFFYILISYKAYWIPYGGTMDYTNGPSEPYIIQ